VDRGFSMRPVASGTKASHTTNVSTNLDVTGKNPFRNSKTEKERRKAQKVYAVVSATTRMSINAIEGNSFPTSWPPSTSCRRSRPTLPLSTAFFKVSSVEMAGQVSAQSRNKVLLAAVKVVSKTYGFVSDCGVFLTFY